MPKRVEEDLKGLSLARSQSHAANRRPDVGSLRIRESARHFTARNTESFDGVEIEVKTAKAQISDLFYFADNKDLVLMSIGACGMLGNGSLQVASNIFFGSSFEGDVGLDGYRDIALKMTYIGLGLMVSNTIGNYFVDVSKQRQLAQWRKGYLKAIMRQDVGWYDVNKPQELSSRMGESLVHIEKGLGGTTFQGFVSIAMGVTGLTIAFAYMWDLALVIMALSPVLVFSMGLMVSVQAQPLLASATKPCVCD